MLGGFYSAVYILDIYSVGSGTHLIMRYYHTQQSSRHNIQNTHVSTFAVKIHNRAVRPYLSLSQFVGDMNFTWHPYVQSLQFLTEHITTFASLIERLCKIQISYLNICLHHTTGSNNWQECSFSSFFPSPFSIDETWKVNIFWIVEAKQITGSAWFKRSDRTFMIKVNHFGRFAPQRRWRNRTDRRPTIPQWKLTIFIFGKVVSICIKTMGI